MSVSATIADEVGLLGGLEDPVGDLDCPLGCRRAGSRPGRAGRRGRCRRGRRRGRRTRRRRVRGAPGPARPPGAEQGPAEARPWQAIAGSVPALPLDLDRPAQQASRPSRGGPARRRPRRPARASSASSAGSVVTVSAWSRKASACSWEPRAAARSAAARSATRAWAASASASAPVGRVLVGREVVAGEGAGELVGPERLEVAGGGEVTDLAVRAARACCRRPRGSATGRRRTGPAPGERGSPWSVSSSRRTRPRRRGSRLGSSIPLTAARRREREALAQHRGVRDERPLGRLEGIEPGGDERGERLRHREGRQIADRAVDAVLAPRAGPRRGACAPSRRRRGAPRRHVRRSPGRPPPAAPARGPPGARASPARAAARGTGESKLRLPAPQSGRLSSSSGPGEGDDVDGDAAAPLEQVVDEVEQAAVGVVEVLEDHHHGCPSRRAARRTSARPRRAARSRRGRARRPGARGGPARPSAARRRRGRAPRRSRRPSLRVVALIVGLEQARTRRGPSRRAPRR